MKTIKLGLIICIGLCLESCYKPGNIKIQNNITKVKIVDVKWGDFYIATELLPGETSEQIIITKDEEKLPKSNKISFKMEANNESIYLETEEEYLLDEDADLLIVLDDNTKVKNPNE
jgi:hypothetical protein